MLVGLLMVLPMLLAIIGFVLGMIGVVGIATVLTTFSGILGTCVIAFIFLMSPSTKAIFDAKLSGKELLMIFNENRKWNFRTGKFKSGWVWIGRTLGFLVSSPDDVGYLDGVPTYVCYRGVGKTLNPRALVDLKLIESNQKLAEEIKAVLERLRRRGVEVEEIVEEEEE